MSTRQSKNASQAALREASDGLARSRGHHCSGRSRGGCARDSPRALIQTQKRKDGQLLQREMFGLQIRRLPLLRRQGTRRKEPKSQQLNRLFQFVITPDTKARTAMFALSFDLKTCLFVQNSTFVSCLFVQNSTLVTCLFVQKSMLVSCLFVQNSTLVTCLFVQNSGQKSCLFVHVVQISHNYKERNVNRHIRSNSRR